MDMREHRGARISEAGWLISGIWLLAFAGMCLTVFVGTSENPAQGYVRAAVMALCGAVMSAIMWKLGSRRTQGTAGRVLFFVAAIVVATTLQVIVDLWVADLVYTLSGVEPPVRRIISDSPARAAIMGILIRSNIAIFATAHALFGMAAVALSGAVQTRERERLLAQAQAAASAAQLSALRYQLNPHFLFNTLNALHSLVESGRPKDAGLVIDRLSDFLRSTLTDSGSALTSLDEELSTIEDYLAIEAVRFGDRLVVRFECPAEVRDARVPSFILQPLVENALKHGVAPALAPVEVKVAARLEGKDLRLWVDNDLPPEGTPTGGPGTGVGLRNTKERLALLYGGAASLTTEPMGHTFRAELRLPIDKGAVA